MITLAADDKRGPKAVALATEPHRWHRVTIKSTGQVVSAIPSQRLDNVYWMTDGSYCNCPAFRYRRGSGPCKHVIAYRLHDQADAAGLYA
jgi:hypothetical protein